MIVGLRNGCLTGLVGARKAVKALRWEWCGECDIALDNGSLLAIISINVAHFGVGSEKITTCLK